MHLNTQTKFHKVEFYIIFNIINFLYYTFNSTLVRHRYQSYKGKALPVHYPRLTRDGRLIRAINCDNCETGSTTSTDER